jgi:leucyl aminopeptidase (aminopeptidase T)
MSRIVEALDAATFMVNSNVNAGEKVLIVSSIDVDPTVYQAMAGAARARGAKIAVVLMEPITKVGESPPQVIIDAMRQSDVVIPCASSSLVHGEFLMELQKHRIRTVSCDCPRGVEDMIENALYRDLEKYKRVSLKVRDELSRATRLKITSSDGSVLKVGIKGMKAIMAGYSIAESPRYEAVYPPAECHIASEEDSANGVVVINQAIQTREKLSSPYLGKVDEPVKLEFKKGWLTKIHGGRSAEALREVLDSSDKNAWRFCEVGFGCNPDVRSFISSPGIFKKSDKKKLGSTHIALGRNYDAAFSALLEDRRYHTDGTIKSNLHLDMVMKDATIESEDKVLVEEGRFKM